MPVYAELHCISNFTFLRGASHAQELEVRAKALGYGALAIVDECSLAGAVRAHVAAKAHGLKLIVGAELQVKDEPKLVLLATNRGSYGHISALITRACRRAVKGSCRLTFDDLEQNLEHCLVLLIPPCARFRLDGLDVSPPVPQQTTPLSSLPPAEAAKPTWHTTLPHALCLYRGLPQRAWIAVELLGGPNDKMQLVMLQELATCTASESRTRFIAYLALAVPRPRRRARSHRRRRKDRTACDRSVVSPRYRAQRSRVALIDASALGTGV